MQKILVIDDDRDMCLLLNRFLSGRGFSVSVAYNSNQALELLELTEPNLVLSDFRLDNNDGKIMLLKIREMYPRLPVIIITGYSDIRIAVEVMKLGAYTYVTKPIFPGEILHIINGALSTPIKKNLRGSHAPADFFHSAEVEQYIFDGDCLQQIAIQIGEVAPTTSCGIIYGESGVGKQVIARQIHKYSKRANKPFCAVDCGALSKELALSELFGHEKGAFSTSLHQKAGYFEQANGGTVFLDEMADLPYEIQLSILQVAEQRKLRRIGGTKDIDIDVRIIVASSEKQGDARKTILREEIVRHFDAFNIVVPPLRNRKEDIMRFASHFLKLTNLELSREIRGFSPEVQGILENYVWFGNLRELRNVIRRSALLTDGDYIEDRTLPFEISNYGKLLFEETMMEPLPEKVSSPVRSASIPRTLLHETTLKEVSIDAEYEMILGALKQTNFNKSRAARSLNIDRKTLYNKMKLYQQLNNH